MIVATMLLDLPEFQKGVLKNIGKLRMKESS
jgi:hypothetical protein